MQDTTYGMKTSQNATHRQKTSQNEHRQKNNQNATHREKTSQNEHRQQTVKMQHIDRKPVKTYVVHVQVHSITEGYKAIKGLRHI